MKKNIIISFIKVWIIASFMFIMSIPMTAHAWGDNEGGRPEYTVKEINEGALGPVGDDAKGQPDYPGIIVFNSISDSTIGHEFNFVSARECVLNPDGTWAGVTKEAIWNANEIEVEDGHTYIIRMYIHNNNPNGKDAVAENTKVEFVVPENSGKEIEVNGIISSSNATPSRYWDHVTFKSDTAFHLEYVYGSALFENNKIGLGGITLSDDVIKTGSTLIGYDKLDGRIPGWYEYDGAVAIRVRPVFDYDFMVDTKIRLAGEKEWQDTIAANVGDKVEFQIEYKNLNDSEQSEVIMRDILPANLCYVTGSTKLIDTTYPNGTVINEDILIGDNGLSIGNYPAGANAFVVFTAEVVNDNLTPGSNTLVNWGEGHVGSTVIQDHASIVVYNDIVFRVISIVLLVLIVICAIVIILLSCKMRYLKVRVKSDALL